MDPYLAAVVALSNSALGDTGVVMVHYTRAQGFSDLPDEATEVARAARDVGVRVGFAVSMKDRNPLVYGASQPVLAALPPDAQAEIERRFLRPPVCTESLNPGVMVMKSTKDGMRFDASCRLNRARDRRIFVQ